MYVKCSSQETIMVDCGFKGLVGSRGFVEVSESTTDEQHH
jgi:hypothetical protein